MLFKSRFFYDDGAAEATGGNAGETTGEQGSDNQQEKSVAIEGEQIDVVNLKAELEELRAFKAANSKEPEKSAEEIAKEAELDKVNFRKFAVENDYAKDEDFVQFETVQQKKDYDLVFESYLKDFKEENEDISDEDELLEAAKDKFEEEYHLSSRNEKTKTRGFNKLSKEAAEIRTPFSSKIEKAKAEYTSKKELASAYEKKFIPFAEEVKKSIPSKLVYSKLKDGDKEVPFELEVTAEDIKEVEDKFIKTHKAFYQFKEGKQEEVQSKLVSKIESYLLSKKRDELNEKIAKHYEGLGVAKGSNTGAENPFPMQQGGGRKAATVLTLEASNQKMAEARSRFN